MGTTDVTHEAQNTRLLDLIAAGSSTTVMIHGFGTGTLFDLMQDGALDELKRETKQQAWGDDDTQCYLVGKTKIDGVDVTLFSVDFVGMTS